jgi:hypothetical protein
MGTKCEKIVSNPLETIKIFQDGIRYSELVRGLQKELPDILTNTIHGTIWNLEVRVPNEIYKPARGLFRHAAFRMLKLVTYNAKFLHG